MRQKFKEWQDQIGHFDITLNKKIAKLDIEQEELQRVRNQIQQ